MIRARFEQRFTAQRMAKDYVAAYSALETALELPVPVPLPAMASARPRSRTMESV